MLFGFQSSFYLKRSCFFHREEKKLKLSNLNLVMGLSNFKKKLFDNLSFQLLVLNVLSRLEVRGVRVEISKGRTVHTRNGVSIVNSGYDC